jgi:hypothetical protein
MIGESNYALCDHVIARRTDLDNGSLVCVDQKTQIRAFGSHPANPADEARQSTANEP